MLLGVNYSTGAVFNATPEFARKERDLHCDVVHITTVWVLRPQRYKTSMIKTRSGSCDRSDQCGMDMFRSVALKLK